MNPKISWCSGLALTVLLVSAGLTACGYKANNYSRAPTAVAVARYNASGAPGTPGTLDPGFGTQGIVTTDVDAFQEATAGRLPENRVLSHDLLEGAVARAGLVSDVLLFEDYPSSYAADVSRRSRWMRGDWQIAAWLGRRVPGAEGRRIENPMSRLSQWKILDNLRRSLVPIALFALLVGGWLVPGLA